MTLEYRRALAEVHQILSHMDKDLREKVPVKFREFIKKNLDPDYPVLLDANKPVKEQKILKDTKVLLSIMYRNYWCTKEEKAELVRQDREERIRQEEARREKYNPDDIFKNSKKVEARLPNEVEEAIKESTPNADLTVYKGDSFINRILNKIKDLFSKFFKK